MNAVLRQLAADLAMVDRVVTLAGLGPLDPVSSICQHVIMDPAQELDPSDDGVWQYLLALTAEALCDPERLTHRTKDLHQLEHTCLVNLNILSVEPFA